jgi:ribonucrease Y
VNPLLLEIVFFGVVPGGLIGLFIGRLWTERQQAQKMLAVTEAGEERLVSLQEEQRKALLEAKDESAKVRAQLETEARERKQDLKSQQQRLTQKEEEYDRKFDQLEKRDRQISQRVGQLTIEEARAEVIHAAEEVAQRDAARAAREIEARARDEAEVKAREIVTLAIQRCASDQVSEVTLSVVPLPNDEMKGRIIGREGRNIRTLESATGVDLIIDDTPEAVILSSFDPVRREIARNALTKLILDGRIHPARIEEMVAKARGEIERVVEEEGQRACMEANITNFPPELVRLVGRLHFRSSYGQNVLNHSIEVSVLAAAMAAELGADVNVCKVAGLLHDLGKAIDQEVEGPHHLISGEIARRFNRSAKIIHAIVAHHATDSEPQSLEAAIVQAADAISAARPGARRETIDLYIKRLESLESIANSFHGVERSFAIQAGREVRIIVKPEELDEIGASQLARDVARKIEESMDYPGQIKVSVVRETRSVEYAK